MYARPGGDNCETDPRFSRESWNVGVSLVWTPAVAALLPELLRPLFNVADNGTFVTRFKKRGGYSHATAAAAPA